MECRQHTQHDVLAIVALFTSVFTKSEGEAQGALVGNLAQQLIAETDARDLFGFVAVNGDSIVGAILFSRLTFEHDIDAFILAPVAVHSDHQGKGIGQTLITHGLNELKTHGVSVVLTYGDPRYYRKVGFHSISNDSIMPPFELSQPEGWLGQSLVGSEMDTFSGRCTCVKALSAPVYW